MLDLRHINDYNKKFGLNFQWKIKLKYTLDTDSADSYEMELGRYVPPPSGFEITVKFPEIFSIMVNWIKLGFEGWYSSSNHGPY